MDVEALVHWLHDPRDAVPGNKMSFAGIPDAPDLADLLAYLRTAENPPAPLPK